MFRLWIVLLLGFTLLAACGGTPTTSITPDAVLSNLKAAGLEAESAQAMQPADYGPAPLLCQDGARRFLIPSIGEDKGGRLFVCSSEGDAAKLKAYYDELGKASAMFHSWTYQKGGVLVQLNGELDQAKAEAYGKVVTALP
jgi:hypothetical protein